MKIVVAVRCYNELNNIERFVRAYSFADKIIISDGGSTDGSLDEHDKERVDDNYAKVDNKLFEERKARGFPVTWNPII